MWEEPEKEILALAKRASPSPRSMMDAGSIQFSEKGESLRFNLVLTSRESHFES
jgi:hypothetical protein